jgi:hypothetical protein
MEQAGPRCDCDATKNVSPVTWPALPVTDDKQLVLLVVIKAASLATSSTEHRVWSIPY